MPLALHLLFACADTPPPPTIPSRCPRRTWWRDADGDGHGDPRAPVRACDPPEGYVATGDDCDDSDADRFPGNPERCDGVDQDCDGVPDDGLVEHEYWPDADRDGYGDAGFRPVRRCFSPPEWVTNGLDCDDSDPAVFPGAGCDPLDTGAGPASPHHWALPPNRPDTASPMRVIPPEYRPLADG